MPGHRGAASRPGAAWRAFLPTAALLASVLAAAALAAYALLVDRALHLISAAERQAVRAAAVAIRDRIRGLGEDARFLATRHLTVEVARAPSAAGAARLADEFVDFATGRRVYDQVRLLDEAGRELVRVNWNGGRPAPVPAAALQDKRDRYYFKDAIRLGQGELYLSPLDLNVEGGQVEVPHKPMVRAATPVFTEGGRRRGVVVLNYLGQELVDALLAEAGPAAGRLVLLDQEGRWLHSPVAAEAWSFMFGRRDQFDARHRETWAVMNEADDGQRLVAEGLWTYAAVRPLGEGLRTTRGTAAPAGPSLGDLNHHAYRWTVATLVPAADLAALRWRTAGLVASGWGLACLLALWGAARWATLRARRDEAEAALRQERRLLASVLGGMAEGLLVHDEDGRIVAANEAASLILGVPPDRLVGWVGLTPTGPAVGEDGQPVSPRALPAAIALERGVATPRQRLRVPRPDGALADLDVAAAPLALQDGGLDRGAVTTFSDASLQRDLQQRMALSAHLASLGTLASGAAHEINSPLAVIVSSLSHLAGELARQGPALPVARELQEAADDALASAHRVRHIVSQLQGFARRGGPTPGDPHDVRGAVDAALLLTREQVRARARLEVSLPPRLPPVCAGADALTQVLVNLLVNAADAIPEGRPESHLVRVVAAARGGEVVVEVSDTGVGIQPSALPHLFDPFFTTKAAGRGIGLGLSLCYGLVREAGGRIEVASAPGEGSTFSVFMPAAGRPASARTESAEAPSTRAAPASSGAVTGSPATSVPSVSATVVSTSGMVPITSSEVRGMSQ